LKKKLFARLLVPDRKTDGTAFLLRFSLGKIDVGVMINLLLCSIYDGSLHIDLVPLGGLDEMSCRK
jgi:hypothetical protein